MYLILIFLPIGAIVGATLYTRYERKKSEGLTDYPLANGLFGALWGSLLGFAISLIIFDQSDKTEVIVRNDKIYNMSTDTASNPFFLGFHADETGSYCYYYVKRTASGFVQEQVDLDRAVIYEYDSLVSPHVVEKRSVVNKSSMGYGWDINLVDPEDLIVEFHVPRGSVKHNYER